MAMARYIIGANSVRSRDLVIKFGLTCPVEVRKALSDPDSDSQSAIFRFIRVE